MPQLVYDTIITDPVWPNNTVNEFYDINPQKLYDEFCGLIKAKRLAVHMGCDSNPSFLQRTPLPFFRVMWLKYALPGFKGRLLQGSDVAYLFGEPPKSRKGNHLIAGECVSAKTGKFPGHPCPRNIDHVSFLCDKWSDKDDVILDPFMGVGTTLAAAKYVGKRAIGIERNERFCEVAVGRLQQESLFLPAQMEVVFDEDGN